MPLAASGPVAECPTRLCPFGIRAARLFRLVSYPPRCNGSPGSLTLSPGRHFLFFSPPAAVSFPPNPTILLRRSEEHTSELQSRPHLVCRLLLEKKTMRR